MWPSSAASTLQDLKTFYQVPAEAWDAFQTATGPMPEDFKALAALPAAVVAAAVSDARTRRGTACFPRVGIYPVLWISSTLHI